MTHRICLYCHTAWPCEEPALHAEQHALAYMPDGEDESIACFVLDHDECTVPLLCGCHCHEDDELVALGKPPSINR
jgi:hypothetical protein